MISNRVQHVALGGFAGVAFFALAEVSPDLHGRVAFALTCFIWAGCGAALALMSETGCARALKAGGALGALVALLAYGAQPDFSETDRLALFILATVPAPFLLQYLRRGTLTHYADLFMDAWNITVRYAAAGAFVLLVWGVLWGSAALLDLVGISALEDLLSEDWAGFVITGAVLGLSLAVVAELSDLVSPYLVLRLLRLLTPFVLAVVAVFLAMVPVRGLTELFGGMSTGGFLLAVAAWAATLVTVVVDREDFEAEARGIVARAAQGLSALVAALAGLALVAVWWRVRDYGWTPDRLAALSAVLLGLGYGLAYLFALAHGAGWRDWVRRGNLAMAWALIGVSVLWLNPFVSAEQISVASQVARIKAGGDVSALSPMAQDWGAAGDRGLAALREGASETLLAQIEKAEEGLDLGPDAAQTRAALDGVPILPVGAVLPEAAAEAIGGFYGTLLTTGCARQTKGGNPACLVMLADFDPATAGEEVVVLMLDRTQPEVWHNQDGWRRDYIARVEAVDVEGIIDAAHRAGFALAPRAGKSVAVDGQVIIP